MGDHLFLRGNHEVLRKENDINVDCRKHLLGKFTDTKKVVTAIDLGAKALHWRTTTTEYRYKIVERGLTVTLLQSRADIQAQLQEAEAQVSQADAGTSTTEIHELRGKLKAAERALAQTEDSRGRKKTRLENERNPHSSISRSLYRSADRLHHLREGGRRSGAASVPDGGSSHSSTDSGRSR